MCEAAPIGARSLLEIGYVRFSTVDRSPETHPSAEMREMLSLPRHPCHTSVILGVDLSVALNICKATITEQNYEEVDALHFPINWFLVPSISSYTCLRKKRMVYQPESENA